MQLKDKEVQELLTSNYLLYIVYTFLKQAADGGCFVIVVVSCRLSFKCTLRSSTHNFLVLAYCTMTVKTFFSILLELMSHVKQPEQKTKPNKTNTTKKEKQQQQQQKRSVKWVTDVHMAVVGRTLKVNTEVKTTVSPF